MIKEIFFELFIFVGKIYVCIDPLTIQNADLKGTRPEEEDKCLYYAQLKLSRTTSLSS